MDMTTAATQIGGFTWSSWVDAVDAIVGGIDTDDPEVWAVWSESYGEFLKGTTPEDMAATIPNWA